jgi:hypothetical protein
MTSTNNESRVETAESYGHVVVRLNPRWRIIACRDGLQWILQYRASAETYSRARWASRSHCRTGEVLIRCVHEHAGAIDPAAAAILAAPPGPIDAVIHPRSNNQESFDESE